MPLYVFRCPNSHVTERLVAMTARDAVVACGICGALTERVVTAPHVEPDGVYSYAPNIGDPAQFERRQIAIKEGKKVIPKEG